MGKIRAGIWTAMLLVVGLPALPAVGAGPFDGEYAGGTVRERGDTGTCGAEQGRARVTVVDSKFAYTWNPAFHVVVTSTIAPDGSVSGAQNYAFGGGRQATVRATGRVSNNTLEVVFDSSYCARRFTLKKAG
jgi:hypothetical protein